MSAISVSISPLSLSKDGGEKTTEVKNHPNELAGRRASMSKHDASRKATSGINENVRNTTVARKIYVSIRSQHLSLRSPQPKSRIP